MMVRNIQLKLIETCKASINDSNIVRVKGYDVDNPEIVLCEFIGEPEDVDDLLEVLDELLTALQRRRAGLDKFGLDRRPPSGDEARSVLSLFDAGLDSPILRNRDVLSFVRKVNMNFVRCRVRRHMCCAIAAGPDNLLDCQPPPS
jgi:hypothetical protein